MQTVQSFQELTYLITCIFLKIKSNGYQNLPIGANFNKIFYRLKRKFSNLFKRLYFDTNGHTPFSEDLEEIFFILKASGFLGWTTTKYFIDYKNSYNFTIEHQNISFISEEKIDHLAKEFVLLLKKQGGKTMSGIQPCFPSSKLLKKRKKKGPAEIFTEVKNDPHGIYARISEDVAGAGKLPPRNIQSR